jgi:hypothetical protein
MSAPVAVLEAPAIPGFPEQAVVVGSGRWAELCLGTSGFVVRFMEL